MIFGIKDNVLTMYGTIWEYDGTDFVYWLSKLESQYSQITIRLHTYGGSVFAGNLMCNALERSTADITIIIDGLAASMGAIFILSSKKVKIVNNGYVMIHAPHSGSYGNAKDHESNAKLLRLMEDNFIDKLMLRTGKSKTEVSEWLKADTWLGAKEALALGLVAEIIPASVDTVYPAFEPDDVGETEAYNMYAALLTSIPTAAVSAFNNYQTNPQLNFNDNMKQLLITALGLTGLDAQSSDTAVLTAVQKKISDVESAANASKTEKETAEAKLKEFENSRITSLIEGATSSLNKPLTEEEKKTYETIGATSGIEALEMVLKNVSKPQAPGIGALIQTGTPGASATGRESWSFDQWQKEDPKGLEALATTDKEKFNTLFNAKYKK
jgi:ATP-dependent Clp protease protease subunit